MSDDEARQFAEKLEANKSPYERAQGQPDPGGITKEEGMQIIIAAADDAEQRQKK